MSLTCPTERTWSDSCEIWISFPMVRLSFLASCAATIVIWGVSTWEVGDSLSICSASSGPQRERVPLYGSSCSIIIDFDVVSSADDCNCILLEVMGNKILSSLLDDFIDVLIMRC